jgi:hypothetical protein
MKDIRDAIEGGYFKQFKEEKLSQWEGR